MSSMKRVCLVLGSGSSRGWAHIGVIDALEEEGIRIDCIAGCSVGSYVGALYAAGCLKSLKDFVLRMDGKKVFSYFDVVFPRSGLLDGTRKLKELFCQHTEARDFSDLKIPLSMVATDLESGDKVVIRSGDLLAALRATLSIPGLFAPAPFKERWLVDGGVVDPVPVGVGRALEADVVIAVDLNCGLTARRKPLATAAPAARQPARNVTPHPRSEVLKKMVDYYESAGAGFKTKINELFSRESATPDIVETVMSAINIMQARITRVNLAVDPPDILIQPRLDKLKMLDFDQVEHVIEEGYIATREKMEDIRALLESE
jgi:NTE family protein